MQRRSFLFAFLALSSLTVLSGQGGCNSPGTYDTKVIPPNPGAPGGSSKTTILVIDTRTGEVSQIQVGSFAELPAAPHQKLPAAAQ